MYYPAIIIRFFKFNLFFGFFAAFSRPGILVLVNDTDWELMVSLLSAFHLFG